MQLHCNPPILHWTTILSAGTTIICRGAQGRGEEEAGGRRGRGGRGLNYAARFARGHVGRAERCNLAPLYCI